MKERLEMVYRYFPRLVERRNVMAGFISGGEQQMTVIGRALMAQPKLMLLDEPSMGLAPLLIKEIFEIITRIKQRGRDSPSPCGTKREVSPHRGALCLCLGKRKAGDA